MHVSRPRLRKTARYINFILKNPRRCLVAKYCFFLILSHKFLDNYVIHMGAPILYRWMLRILVTLRKRVLIMTLSALG
jgi:hypothetical protein